MSMPKILIVDDEESLRMTLAANLELEDFDVLEADTAERALEILERERVDIVLSDIRMPGVGGIELLRQVHRRGLDVPVVLMTAFTDESSIRDAMGNGVFAVLGKPFDMEHAVGTLLRAKARPLVLVVDDVETDAKMMAEVFNVAGIRARHVSSPTEAVEMMSTGSVDVCITDLVMPDMDGVALAKRVKETVRGVSVVVFSAHNVPELMHRAASDGAYACLRKPVNPEELIRTVAKLRGDPKYGLAVR
jgi:DNA-binding NtrC family response regulator